MSRGKSIPKIAFLNQLEHAGFWKKRATGCKTGATADAVPVTFFTPMKDEKGGGMGTEGTMLNIHSMDQVCPGCQNNKKGVRWGCVVVQARTHHPGPSNWFDINIPICIKCLTDATRSQLEEWIRKRIGGDCLEFRFAEMQIMPSRKILKKEPNGACDTARLYSDWDENALS